LLRFSFRTQSVRDGADNCDLLAATESAGPFSDHCRLYGAQTRPFGIEAWLARLTNHRFTIDVFSVEVATRVADLRSPGWTRRIPAPGWQPRVAASQAPRRTVAPTVAADSIAINVLICILAKRPLGVNTEAPRIRASSAPTKRTFYGFFFSESQISSEKAVARRVFGGRERARKVMRSQNQGRWLLFRALCAYPRKNRIFGASRGPNPAAQAIVGIGA